VRTPLHILHLESAVLDAQIIEATLGEAIAAEVTGVQTLTAFVEALQRGDHDVILSEYASSSLDGISALKIAREKKPDIPFIFVSRSPGEEAAIESLKMGASDFVLKHRLNRLAHSVLAAVSDAEKRAQRKLLEDYLGQAAKLESISTFAGGVAHDLNNLLTAIIGQAQLAQSQLDAANPISESIGHIEQTARRAAQLTRDLLIFSRLQGQDARPISLNDALGDFVQTLQRIVSDDIEVRLERAPGLPLVTADPSQIAQVLMNLAINSRDAMSGSGRITISTRDLTLNDDYCRRHPAARPGRYVEIELADTGIGLEPESEARIFEPFFTTKAGGIGLGLSVVYGIIKQHSGFIQVQSEPGLGTRFSLFLPIKQEAAQPVPQIQNEPLQGSETILVAEDDAALRRLVSEVLNGLGYHVILARDGLEAVELFASNQTEIDLVTLDILMPKVGGLEAYRRIRQLEPEVPVIFMTGNIHQARAVEDTDAGVLQKPYSVELLGREVRRMLNRSRSKSSSGKS
jgi:two-component system, cell cycle sensor histidine kinase and response regulator CckA